MNQTYKGKLEWQRRYAEAHYQHYQRNHPVIVADGHYTNPVMPKVTTANGLTKFIVNYLDWTGCHGNRIAAMGRMIKQGKDTVTPMGTIKAKSVMIPGATKKGTADVLSVINGRSVAWEIKIGKDRISEAQVKQQQAIRRAGGYYYFVPDVDTFFTIYDKFMNAPKIELI